MRYPGGKNCAGTYQAIINQIPPHRWYLEPFAGSAAILRMKRPAERSTAIDASPGAIAALAGMVPPSVELLVGDGVAFLERWAAVSEPETFVYCDPPYLPSAIKSRLRYEHKLSEDDHVRLLDILLTLRCKVMLSGYWSELYAEKLAGWRTVKFPQITRGGYSIDEWLWMNYPEPVELHDYRYLGQNYRQRENFKQQRLRWEKKLRGMSLLQRRALLAAMLPATSVDSQVSADAGKDADDGSRMQERRLDRPSAKPQVRTSPPEPAVAAATGKDADGTRCRVLHLRNGRCCRTGKASGG